MRGRRPKKEKAPRARRHKIVTAGCPLIYCPWQDDRTGVIIGEGHAQSVVYFDDDVDDMPREVIMPHSWFKRGKPPRVRLKLERVKLKTQRVRLV